MKPHKYEVGYISDKNILVLEQIRITRTSKVTKSGFTDIKGYKVKCLSCGKIYEVAENNFPKTGCKECEYKKVPSKYKVGEIVNGFEILDIKKGTNKKPLVYIVRCLSCNQIIEKTATNLIEYGCPICCFSPNIVVKGVNDVSTTHPHLVKYFANPEDATKVTYCSSKKIALKCPICGHIKHMKLSSLNRGGFVCLLCSDNISRPNKFMNYVLGEKQITFITEYSPKWANGKRYDFYLPDYKIIIEMDGGFHFKDNKMSNQTREDSMKIDKLKDIIALNNGLYVIRLNCEDTSFDYMYNSLIKSNLLHIIHEIENFDKDKCVYFLSTSLKLEACKMFDNGLSQKEIGEKLHKHPSTVSKWLNEMSKHGLCTYNKEEILKATRNNLNVNHEGMKIKIVELDKIYPSLSELDRKSIEELGIRFSAGGVSQAIKNNRKYKGFTLICL